MTTEKRIACIDCKHCEYKPLSEEEKEEYYQADRDFRKEIELLSPESQEIRYRYWKTARRRIRMKEYTCHHYRTESFDYLTGEVKVSSGIDCDSYRSSVLSNKCGYDAIFFEPKNPKIEVSQVKHEIETPQSIPPQTVGAWLKSIWKEVKNG